MKVLDPVLFAVIMVIFTWYGVLRWNKCRTSYSFSYCVLQFLTAEGNFH
jgi:hypothetical protein